MKKQPEKKPAKSGHELLEKMGRRVLMTRGRIRALLWLLFHVLFPHLLSQGLQGFIAAIIFPAVKFQLEPAFRFAG